MRTHSNLESIPHSDAHAGLARWRELSRQANAAFDRRDHAQAQRLYQQALRVAQALIAGPALATSPDDCLAATVVAHHNLSETNSQLGDCANALEHLCCAHESLTRIACDPHATDLIRRCAVRHMSRTRLALLDWQTTHGACARSQTSLRDSLSALSSLGAALH